MIFLNTCFSKQLQFVYCLPFFEFIFNLSSSLDNFLLSSKLLKSFDIYLSFYLKWNLICKYLPFKILLALDVLELYKSSTKWKKVNKINTLYAVIVENI